jgi:hypothetical protein
MCSVSAWTASSGDFHGSTLYFAMTAARVPGMNCAHARAPAELTASPSPLDSPLIVFRMSAVPDRRCPVRGFL